MSDTQKTDLQMYFHTRRSSNKKNLQEPGPNTNELQEILKLASRTPDYGNLTPWRFIVVQSLAVQKLEAKIQQSLHPKGSMELDKPKLFFDTPCLVIVIGCNKPHQKISAYEQDLSVGAACMNLLHAANSYGYGGVWLTGKIARDPIFLAEMDLCAEEKLAGIIYLGSTNEEREDRARPDISELVQEYT